MLSFCHFPSDFNIITREQHKVPFALLSPPSIPSFLFRTTNGCYWFPSPYPFLPFSDSSDLVKTVTPPPLLTTPSCASAKAMAQWWPGDLKERFLGAGLHFPSGYTVGNGAFLVPPTCSNLHSRVCL